MDDPVFELVRPADLLVARITLHNLTFRLDSLVRTLAGADASIVITFPPQHYREQIPGSNPPPLLAAAAPSSLVFTVPPEIAELPLGPDGVWGVCETLELSDATQLAVPARVDLAPIDARWMLDPKPHTLSSGTDLWRGRLRPRADGTTGALFVIRTVHESDFPQWTVLPTQEQLRQRRGGIMAASRFDLSALGATARLKGPIDFDPSIVDPASVVGLLNSYQHEIDFGRDSRVTVVTHGHLTTGHPATLIEVSERIFDTSTNPEIWFFQGSMAFLRLTRMLVVDEPLLSVDALKAAYGGLDRDMPFRTLRLVTTAVSALVDVPDTGPFWVRRSDGDVRFAFEATDWSGRACSFSLPLIFIPDGQFDFDRFFAIRDIDNLARHQASLAGSIVTLADGRGRSDAAATAAVDFVRFNVTPPADVSVSGFVTAAPLLTFVSRLGVVLDAVTQVTGTRHVLEATWHDTYRSVGLDDANPLGVYLRLINPQPLSLDAQRVGALAKPDMVLGAITTAKGAVPAGFELDATPDAATIKDLFAGARILGIDLTEVIDLTSLKPPEMVTRANPELVEVRYVWHATLKPNTTVLLKADPQPASLTLTSTTTRRIADGQTTGIITGQLTNVALDFAGMVKLHFDSLRFTSEPNRKPEVVPSGMRLDFSGELAFLNDLRTALESTGLPTGASVDVTTDRITAGYTAALPTLPLGMLTITNLAVVTRLTIPFDGAPVAFRFALADRYTPFGLSYSGFTGGGFFALELDTTGIRRIEAALEFGGSLALDLVVARGAAHVMAGIYFMYDAVLDKVIIAGYLRAGGQLEVLGIISISAEFYMQLSYDPSTKRVNGYASLTIGIRVLFLSKSVTLSVERSFVGSAVDPSFSDCFELDDWGDYCRAFA